MTGNASQPIVILGGFLSPGTVYAGMRQALAAHSGQPVSVVDTQVYDWLPSVSLAGWALLLMKLDRTVRRAAQDSATGKVTLVGHSAGGVLARIFLSPEPFLGRRYAGLERVVHLITLGSPHHNQGGLRRGGRMSRWADRHYPGAAFSPPVTYTSVAGKLSRGDPNGLPRAQWAGRVYREICGDGEAWGDGLVPVPSALLSGSGQIVLDGVSHYSIFGARWYGSPEVLPLWWDSAAGDGCVTG